MYRYRVAAAVAAAAFILLSAGTQAASFRDPVLRSDAPGETSAAEDPFRPQSKPKTKTYTYDLSCEVSGKFGNGAPALKMVNTGTETIPAGAIIAVTYPDGTKKKFTTSSEIKPGGAVSVMGPLGATPESFPCAASATSTGPSLPDGPVGPDVPTANPNLPPKLVCEFTIVGKVVTITWQNIGGSPVMPGQFISGTTSGGIGMTISLTDPIEPGDEFKVSHAWDNFDPAWFDGETCSAKIKK